MGSLVGTVHPLNPWTLYSRKMRNRRPLPAAGWTRPGPLEAKLRTRLAGKQPGHSGAGEAISAGNPRGLELKGGHYCATGCCCWQSSLLWLPAQLQRAPPAFPNVLHVQRCVAVPVQPPAWLRCLLRLGALAAIGERGSSWVQALRLLAVWPPGCCMGLVGAWVVPLLGTSSVPALAGHAAGSRLGALGGGAPALLGASSLQAWWPCEAGQAPADTRSPLRCDIRPKHVPHMPTRRPHPPTWRNSGNRQRACSSTKADPPQPPAPQQLHPHLPELVIAGGHWVAPWLPAPQPPAQHPPLLSAGCHSALSTVTWREVGGLAHRVGGEGSGYKKKKKTSLVFTGVH
ncbi:hypothetical protein HaLaN_02019 [Haematococcus lacustris]|uniref:Uncharacterized protein n=1 Tax=Haematococcus lacustris TaxID=44745 RepID=A0A699YW27_HAELA|nr:hypothetical protein HaLaN_02019 [Haematococcus lacustris]